MTKVAGKKDNLKPGKAAKDKEKKLPVEPEGKIDNESIITEPVEKEVSEAQDASDTLETQPEESGSFSCPLCGEEVDSVFQDYHRHQEEWALNVIKETNPDWVDKGGISPKALEYYRLMVLGSVHAGELEEES